MKTDGKSTEICENPWTINENHRESMENRWKIIRKSIENLWMKIDENRWTIYGNPWKSIENL